MDKREMIERALGRYYKLREMLTVPHGFHKQMDFDALAEQAIVIECEVEHITGTSVPTAGLQLTRITHHDRLLWSDMGHHGTPGKATCIIVHDPETGILPDRASIEDGRTDSASMEEEDGSTSFVTR